MALKLVLVIVIIIKDKGALILSSLRGSYGRFGEVRTWPIRIAVSGGQSKSGVIKYFFG